MKKIIALALILFLQVNIFAQNNSDWKLIYHNNKDGKTVSGKIETLIEAIRKGEKIRIYWFFQHPTNKIIKVEHVTKAKFLTILSDSVVLGQIDPIIGQIPNFESQSITLKENLEWSFIAATNGKCDTMTRNVVTGEIIEHKLISFDIKWFIRQ